MVRLRHTAMKAHGPINQCIQQYGGGFMATCVIRRPVWVVDGPHSATQQQEQIQHDLNLALYPSSTSAPADMARAVQPVQQYSSTTTVST